MTTKVNQVMLLGSLLGSVMGCSDYNITDDEQSVQSYGPRPKENDALLEDVNSKYASMISEGEGHNVTSDSHSANVYTTNSNHNKSLWEDKLKNDKNLKENVSSLKEILSDQNKEMVDYIDEGHLGSASIKVLSDGSFFEHNDYVKAFDHYEKDMTQVYLFKLPGFTLNNAESCPFFDPYVSVFKDKTKDKNINIHEYSLGSWYCGDETCLKDNNTLDNKRDILDLNIKYLLSRSWNSPKNNFIVSINESAGGLAATDFWSSVISDKSIDIDPTQLYITYIHTPHNGTKIVNLVKDNTPLQGFLKEIPSLGKMYGCDNAFNYLACDSAAIKAQSGKLKTLYDAKVGLFNSYGGDGYDILIPTKSANFDGLLKDNEWCKSLQIKRMGHLPKELNVMNKLNPMVGVVVSLFASSMELSLYDAGFDYNIIYEHLKNSDSKIYDPIIAKLPNK